MGCHSPRSVGSMVLSIGMGNTMSREIEMEIGKVARQQAGLVREIARLHHHLLRLKAQYDEIARQREGL